MNQHLMKSFLRVALFCAGIVPLWAAPTVSGVRVSQRDGTNLVDVYYDLSGSGEGGARITVELSDNGGTSYGLAISALSGDVGSGITNGRNRHLVWDAGADRPGTYSATMRLRLAAVDTPPITGEFALIPAGNFTMGRTSGDTDSNAPPVNVYVSGFYMARHEVTKELWDEVRAWGLNNGYTDLPVGNGSYASKGANHPVHSITWFAMVKWCNARSDKENLSPCYTVGGVTYKTGSSAPDCNWNADGYRLPTEAEWEKAARGGVAGLRFPWGDTISHSQANYRVYSSNGTTNHYSYDVTPRPPANGTNYCHPAYNDGVSPYTSPVGSFTPNGYGLFDMAGNVWEWNWDWYSASTYVNGASDPKGPASGAGRVLRGGSWGGDAFSCRAADRDNDYATYANNGIGFRLARSSVP